MTKIKRAATGKSLISKKNVENLISESLLLNKQYAATFSEQVSLLSSYELKNLYDKLIDNIITFSKYYHSSLNEVDKEAIYYIYLSAHQVIDNLKTGRTIVNFEYLSYLNEVAIPEYETLINSKRKALHNKEYQKNIDIEISNAQGAIKQLTEDITQTKTQLDAQINILNNSLKDTQDNQEKYLEKVKLSATLRTISSALKFVGGTVSYLGPYGAAGGAALSGSGCVVDIFNPDVKPLALKDLNPLTYLGSNDKTEKTIDSSKLIDTLVQVHRTEQKMEFNEENPFPIIPVLQENANETQRMEQAAANAKMAIVTANRENYINQLLPVVVNEYKIRLDAELEQSKTSSKIGVAGFIKKYSKEIDSKLKNSAEALNTVIANPDLKKNYQNYVNEKNKYDQYKMANKIVNVMQVANNAIAVYQDIRAAWNQVDEAEAKLDKFKRNCETIKSYIEDHIRNIDNALISFGQELYESNSHSKGDYATYKFIIKIQGLIIPLRDSLKDYEYNGKSTLFMTLDNFLETGKTLARVYDRIEDSKDKKLLADLITATSEPSVTVRKEYPNISELAISLKSQILIAEVSGILHSIKQSQFPEGSFYNSDKYNKAFEDSQDLNIIKLISNVKTAYKCYMLSKYSIQQSKSKNFELEFDGKSSPPFSQWLGSDITSQLTQLLRGKEIELFPNVIKSPRGLEAIKFKKLNIELTIQSSQDKNSNAAVTQADLTDDLSNFDVELTSSGKYYYRFNEEYFNFPNTSIPLSFRYGNEQKGMEEKYKILASGDYIFSPYSQWSVRLYPKSESPISEHQLYEKYKDSIQDMVLSMTGLGKCININSYDSAISVSQEIILNDCYEEYKVTEAQVMGDISQIHSVI